VCRNIKPLYNLEPPVGEEEVRNAALQFVRKVSGFNKPSRVNESAFADAVDEITAATTRLLESLQTSAPRRDRDQIARRAKEHAARRQ
jgi:hypothetical protein